MGLDSNPQTPQAAILYRLQGVIPLALSFFIFFPKMISRLLNFALSVYQL